MENTNIQAAKQYHFSFDNSLLSVFNDKNGEPWFIAKECALFLGHTNPERAIRKFVNEEDRRVTEVTTHESTRNVKREVTIINEPGLYSLALQSKTEGAKQFTRWVTHEVLPAIRKDGFYSTLSDLDLAKLLIKRGEVGMLTDDGINEIGTAQINQKAAARREELDESLTKAKGFISQKRKEWSNLSGEEADKFLRDTLEECSRRFPDFIVYGLLPNQIKRAHYMSICVPYTYAEFHSLPDETRLTVIKEALGED